MNIVIDGKKVKAKEGQTILEVAENNDIKLPSLCYHPDLDVKANCRMCLVEIVGKQGLSTACSTRVKDKMRVITDSIKIRKLRKTNLELILSQHTEECYDCVWSLDCSLLNLAREYNVDISRFKDRKSKNPIFQFNSSLEFDSRKCIDCRNCVDVCEKQGVSFLELTDKGVLPSNSKEKDCIYCGQCITHCPSGSFEAKGEFEEVLAVLNDKKKIVVFQFAPAIRSSIGEEFSMKPGTIVTDKLVGAIKKLGANFVFDVAVGADFTTTIEAEELKERIKKNQLPMFTSCCPAWVKFIEFYYPEFIKNLTTARSPHIMSGGVIKTYFAKKNKIDPRNIFVVSIMPCVSKKYEIERQELRINGLKPVDLVLTTRELAFLLLKKDIDLKNVNPEKADSPLSSPSGAGVIYGSTGGVMESALRTAYEMITGKKLSKINFKNVRGSEGIKKARVNIGGKILNVCVINGTGNAKKVLEQLKKNSKLFDYIEVMACFSGCIGGGGQPMPTNKKIRKIRADALYRIDSKLEKRVAHRNPEVKKVLKSLSKDLIKKVFYTSFDKKKKEN